MEYYIDPYEGNDSLSGTGAGMARRSLAGLSIQPGDTVRFRCGTVIRGKIDTTAGAEGAPVRYASYGSGKKPVFCGSEELGKEEDWEEARPGIWKCRRLPKTEAGNLIFGDGSDCGTLRWTPQELDEPGDWYDSRMGLGEKAWQVKQNDEYSGLFLRSDANPARAFGRIECAVYGRRNLAECRPHVWLENLGFFGSGVHGFSGMCGKDNRVTACDFRMIGGVVWDRDRKIRFGNGVEFWNTADRVWVEDCYFDQIYDSCVTHQGGEECVPAYQAKFLRNHFRNYGMAAYEVRDRMPVESVFEDNVCEGAGLGFAAQGATDPRMSEIYPEPMGHHIFMWRIREATEGGSLLIKGNHFRSAPKGAAVYSDIAKEAWNQVRFVDNRYECTEWLGKKE